MALAVNYITEDDALGWFNHCGLGVAYLRDELKRKGYSTVMEVVQ